MRVCVCVCVCVCLCLCVCVKSILFPKMYTHRMTNKSPNILSKQPNFRIFVESPHLFTPKHIKLNFEDKIWLKNESTFSENDVLL